MDDRPAFPPRRTRDGDPYADARYLPGARDAPLDLAEVFPTLGEGPIELEIGGGRGMFFYERLAADPAIHLLGLEIRRKWATIVDRKLHALGVQGRARNFAEDARLALPRLRPSARLRAVFMHFPDPWWKKRHEKRLVMGEGVQAEIERLLAPGGILFVQTDVEHRAAQYRAFLDGRPAMEPWGDAPGDPSMAENPYGARSNREKRAIVDGLPIHRLRYRRRVG